MVDLLHVFNFSAPKIKLTFEKIKRVELCHGSSRKIILILYIDYRCADIKEKSWRVERRHWRHSIGLDSLFQKTPMFILKKRTVKPGYAFENTAF